MGDIKLQIMDITSLKAVLADLRKKIIPSRFERVKQIDSSTIQIGFRSLTNFIWIEISWHADSSRIVEIQSAFKAPGSSTLAQQIQHGLKGMALVEVNQEGFDRVVEFHFAFRPNEKFKKILVIELMGRHSNLLLLDEQKQVITLGKQIRKFHSRLRPISTGDQYFPPPQLKGLEPDSSISFEDWRERLLFMPIDLGQALKTNFQGISPSLSMQLAADEESKAKEILGKKVQKLSIKEWEGLYLRWSKWLKDLKDENFCLSFNGSTTYRVWNAGKSEQENKKNISIRLGNYYRESLDIKKLNQLENELLNKLSKLKVIEENSLKKQEILLFNKSETKSLQEKANSILCLSNPSKEKIKEAQLLYKKVKKIIRSESIIEKRITHHKIRVNFILETRLYLENIISNGYENSASKISSIKELKESFESCLGIQVKEKTKQRSKSEGCCNVLEIISPSGLTIQIGRNHFQNELISIKKARKGDIWFHAQECPGSHVVVKASNGVLEDLDLQIAADLAAYFSRGKNNQKVPVIMTPTTKLQKLKGANPGTINHREGKVLWGIPSNGKSHIEKSTANAQNALSSFPR